jgi:hypothetical protein
MLWFMPNINHKKNHLFRGGSPTYWSIVFGGLDRQRCCNYTQLEIQWNCFIEAPHDDGLEST